MGTQNVKSKYTHYVVIDGVAYPYFENNTPCIDLNSMQHPKDPTSYLLDIGETTKQRKLLESKFTKYKGDPDFLIIPKLSISTIGAKPTYLFNT